MAERARPDVESALRRVQGADAASALNEANPRVYLDLEVDGAPLGRLVFELFAKEAPRTSENFRALCTGEKGFGYAGSAFHKIVAGVGCYGGNFTNHTGNGGRSIYGGLFDDEPFALRHSAVGALSMVSNRPDTNGSVFQIGLAPAPWLNGKQVVFGLLVEGREVLAAVAKYGSNSGRPTAKVVVRACGETKTSAPAGEREGGGS